VLSGRRLVGHNPSLIELCDFVSGEEQSFSMTALAERPIRKSASEFSKT
jgi:hypothetical protein